VIRPARDPIIYPGVPIPDSRSGRWVLTDNAAGWAWLEDA
jgi:hypothetical protein